MGFGTHRATCDGMWLRCGFRPHPDQIDAGAPGAAQVVRPYPVTCWQKIRLTHAEPKGQRCAVVRDASDTTADTP